MSTKYQGISVDRSTQLFFKQLATSFKILNRDEEIQVFKIIDANKLKILKLINKNSKIKSFLSSNLSKDQFEDDDEDSIMQLNKLLTNKDVVDCFSLSLFNKVIKIDELTCLMSKTDKTIMIKSLDILNDQYKIVIGSNTKLVASYICKKYNNDDFDFFDLLNEGIIGLNTAIDKYESSKNLKFCTYAIHWVKHYINRALQNKSNNIRVPVYIQELSNKVRREESRNIVKNEVSNDVEMAKKFKVSVNNLQNAKNIHSTVSLSKVIDDTDGNKTLEDFLQDDPGSNPENVVMINEHTNKIYNMLELIRQESSKMDKKFKISNIEIEVYKARNGIGCDKMCTYGELSKVFDYTKERIRQIDMSFQKKIQHPTIRKLFANLYEK
jgi:RNA polymerase primary sigma factor